MLRTAATFLDPRQAEIARGRLSEEGVESFLWDEHLIGINWLYSNALHGVKLQVAEHQLAEASGILESDYRDLLTDQEGDGGAPICAHCGSTITVPYRPMRILAALTLFSYSPIVLLLGVPFIKWRARWRCLNCKMKMP
jgi:hypothetical protein